MFHLLVHPGAGHRSRYLRSQKLQKLQWYQIFFFQNPILARLSLALLLSVSSVTPPTSTCQSFLLAHNERFESQSTIPKHIKQGHTNFKSSTDKAWRMYFMQFAFGRLIFFRNHEEKRNEYVSYIYYTIFSNIQFACNFYNACANVDGY